MVKKLRAVAALVFGMVFTFLIALTTIAVAFFTTPLCHLLARDRIPNPAQLVWGPWSWVLDLICYRWLLGVQDELAASAPRVKKGEILLVTGAHPSTLGVVKFFRYLAKNHSARIIVVAKRDLLLDTRSPGRFLLSMLWAVFAGIALFFMRSAIFIDRDNRETALTAISRGVGRVHGLARTRTVLVIFSDKHRPTAARIAADVQKFRAKGIFGVEMWLTETCMGRLGGTRRAVEALRVLRVRFRVTKLVGFFDLPDEGFDPNAVAGRTFQVHEKDITALMPTDDIGWRKFMEWWTRANNRRMRIRRESC